MSTTTDNIETGIAGAAAIAAALAPFFPGAGATIVLVAQLIAKVGWPATKHIIDLLQKPQATWTVEDTARVDAIISTPVADYEKGIVELPGSGS